MLFLALNLFICEAWKPFSAPFKHKQKKIWGLASIPVLYEEWLRSCVEKILLCK